MQTKSYCTLLARPPANYGVGIFDGPKFPSTRSISEVMTATEIVATTKFPMTAAAASAYLPACSRPMASRGIPTRFEIAPQKVESMFTNTGLRGANGLDRWHSLLWQAVWCGNHTYDLSRSTGYLLASSMRVARVKKLMMFELRQPSGISISSDQRALFLQWRW